MINELDPRRIAEMLSEHLDEEELKEMLSDGGIDLDELTTIFAKIGRKLSTKEIEKFNKLDKNKTDGCYCSSFHHRRHNTLHFA